jgi:hypothetical protein
MRFRTAAKTLVAASVLTATSALALPVLTPGPLSLQYFNDEQFSASNSINCGVGCTEGNWGVVLVTNISVGTVQNPVGSDIQGGGTPVFTNLQNGGNQITGIFYGVQVDPNDPTKATGGVLDLYFWDVNNQNTGTLLASGPGALRTAQDQFTGYTCAPNTPGCTFLARLDFASGQLAAAGDNTTTISTAVNPTTADGTAHSYLEVNTGAGGAWASLLDSNFFTLNPTNNAPFPGYTRDIRLDSNFNHSGATAWNGPIGTDIVGLQSNDPARFAAVPEPGSLVLLAAALVGLALGQRRRVR